MKTKIISLMTGGLLLLPLHGISETGNELLGDWKLTDLSCENKEIPEEFKLDPQTMLGSELSVSFQEDGASTQIEKLPILPITICLRKYGLDYSITDNMLLRTVSSYEVDCLADDPNYKEAVEQIEKNLIERYKTSTRDLSAAYSFQVQENKLFIYHQVDEKVAFLKCDQDDRIVEEYTRL